jgi:hypothetical protein
LSLESPEINFTLVIGELSRSIFLALSFTDKVSFYISLLRVVESSNKVVSMVRVVLDLFICLPGFDLVIFVNFELDWTF